MTCAAASIASATDASRRGRASIAVARSDGASAIVGLRAGTPLKAIAVRPRGPAAWAAIASFGGGLLPGDDLRVRLRVGPGAALHVGTPAATKVFRSDGRPSRSRMSAGVAAGALLVWFPDPTAAFAGAAYVARQRVALAAGASLALVDILAAGRPARGERWSATRCRTRTLVLRAGRPLVCDALDLGVDAAAHLARWGCVATCVLSGPRVHALAASIIAAWNATPPRAGAALHATACPLEDGALLRVVGAATDQVERLLRTTLAPLATELGGQPWAHRF